jgi:hypothetical protein
MVPAHKEVLVVSRRMLPFVAVLLCGCAEFPRTTPLKEQLASYRPRHYERDGFHFAAALPSDSGGFQTRHYGVELTDYGILPLEIFLQNTSADSSFSVTVHDASLQLQDGTAFTLLNVEEVVDAAGYSYWRTLPYFLLFIFPGIIECFNVAGANEAMAMDYADKVLNDLDLPKDGKMQGVIFLQPVGKDLDDCKLKDANLKLPVTKRPGGILPNVSVTPE